MSQHDHFTALCVEELLKRRLPDGGFALYEKESHRPDPTAWAIMALDAADADGDIVKQARGRLAADQHEDGRVSVFRPFAAAFWPTSLAVLAWQGAREFQQFQNPAIDFLLETTGTHDQPDPAWQGHDTTILAWPWIEGTHSWAEPTALALLALKTAGCEEHRRVREAIRMAMDRQLPGGGWNYGNTVIFGKKLRPTPNATGMLLHTLSGVVEQNRVQASIDYLHTRVPGVRTPLSLGWALLGLGSWAGYPPDGRSWLMECLERQDYYGSYDTCQISLLLLAYLSGDGHEGIGKNMGG